MTSMVLLGNSGFGIRVVTDDCGAEGILWASAITGTVSGEGNVVAGRGEFGANRLGAICPVGYEHLMEPVAED